MLEIIKYFVKIERFASLILSVLCILFFSIGLYQALVVSPQDYQQGDYVRILYVHVPSAWMGLGIYTFIGLSSVVYIIWRNEWLNTLAKNSASVGAIFVLITLITGSLWGKPIWGAWWVWDSRLTSMLILFFFYISYIFLCKSLENQINRNDAPAILAIVGLINIPIVKFSVDLWTTLHQPSSILRLGGPSIHSSMLVPLLLMFMGCICFSILIISLKAKTETIKKKLIRRALLGL